MNVNVQAVRSVTVAGAFWDRLPFDVRSPEYHADPYPYLERLRAGGPVTRLAEDVVAVTGYRECSAVLGDERFGMKPLGAQGQSLLMTDPPEHRQLRARVTPPFAARAVDRLRPAISRRVAELLAGIDPTGEVDVVAGLGAPLALEVICDLIGMELTDRPAWFEPLSWLATGLDPEALHDEETRVRVASARLDFARYLGGLITDHRENPRDDFVSALVAPGRDGTVLTEAQIVAGVSQLVVAGFEPALNLIANGLRALLAHPDQLDRLRERPGTAPAVVEELLRFDPPIQLIIRVALRDAAIGDTEIPAGAVVGLLVGAANRDPGVYEEPHRLDTGRLPQHLALGWGEHFCLGARLVRVQAQLMLTALARCRPMAVGEPARYRNTLISRGLERLPVVLTAVPEAEGRWP
ncbi:cytochrome P450 [Streptomyces qinzhouensis]|uniref:Cytochrome P450 n=1 Tax=Streptomyces qinzhouensis TaxID=2599401 RepID=A0A5B8JI51_9ACTN|nr:cytochrome P450 [Streptomyces qinzhouensis]QDY80034.1 cytochrome P450 [Streptomyces qinzhouensis]